MFGNDLSDRVNAVGPLKFTLKFVFEVRFDVRYNKIHVCILNGKQKCITNVINNRPRNNSGSIIDILKRMLVKNGKSKHGANCWRARERARVRERERGRKPSFSSSLGAKRCLYNPSVFGMFGVFCLGFVLGF